MAASLSENQLGISWRDSAWVPVLNGENVLHYFCQRSNPFYDRTCNNEVVKMQRLDPAQVKHMTGVDYELIHGQDPILYVIRKQHRHSPSEVTYLAAYYVLAGTVYQAPDLGSVLNSRILSAVHNVQQTFEEALSYARYNPSKGYSWQFPETETKDKKKAKSKDADAGSSLFQRQRIDVLLGDFVNKFPPQVIQESGLKKEGESELLPQKSDPATPADTKDHPASVKSEPTSKPTSAFDASVESQLIGPKVRHAVASSAKPSTPPVRKRKL